MGYKAEKLEMGVRFQKSLTNRGTPNFEDRNTRFLSSQMQKASFAPRARRLFSHLVGKSSTRDSLKTTRGKFQPRFETSFQTSGWNFPLVVFKLPSWMIFRPRAKKAACCPWYENTNLTHICPVPLFGVIDDLIGVRHFLSRNKTTRDSNSALIILLIRKSTSVAFQNIFGLDNLTDGSFTTNLKVTIINGYFQMEDEEHSLNIFGNAHPSAGVSLNTILMVSIISQI